MRTCFILILCVFISSCKRKDNNVQYENIPQVGVNLYLNLDQPSNFNLTAVGGYIYVDGGSKGIIVYRDIDGYRAYERHSPHKSTESCSLVSVDSTGIYGVEGCDQIKYYLTDGTVATGNSSIPLLQYQTRESQGILQVFN